MSNFEDLRYKIIKKTILQKDVRHQRKIISKLPPTLAHRVFHYVVTKKDLNLKNPTSFNDKIHYLELWVHGTRETNLADKYLVRHYLEQKGYSNLAPKLYAIYDSADDIEPKTLPRQFVLKCNHGCGGIEFCENKAKFDFKSAKTRLTNALSNDFSTQSLEPHYHNIKRKIICEEFLPHQTGHLPFDYKFYCFNGKAECILVCSEREKELRLDYYDLNWNYLPYAKPEYRSSTKIPKPKNLKKMVKIAETLSKGFPFVRIDLYNTEGEIRFSEMTFTPAAGIATYNTDEAFIHFGSLIKLPPKQHKPIKIKMRY